MAMGAEAAGGGTLECPVSRSGAAVAGSGSRRETSWPMSCAAIIVNQPMAMEREGAGVDERSAWAAARRIRLLTNA